MFKFLTGLLRVLIKNNQQCSFKPQPSFIREFIQNIFKNSIHRRIRSAPPKDQKGISGHLLFPSMFCVLYTLGCQFWKRTNGLSLYISAVRFDVTYTAGEVLNVCDWSVEGFLGEENCILNPFSRDIVRQLFFFL